VCPRRFDPSEHSHSIKSRVETILALPIKDYLGKNVGVIDIINKRDSSGGQGQNQGVAPFSSEDEDILNSLAYTAGAVLRKSKLYDMANEHWRFGHRVLCAVWHGGRPHEMALFRRESKDQGSGLVSEGDQGEGKAKNERQPYACAAGVANSSIY